MGHLDGKMKQAGAKGAKPPQVKGQIPKGQKKTPIRYVGSLKQL